MNSTEGPQIIVPVESLTLGSINSNMIIPGDFSMPPPTWGIRPGFNPIFSQVIEVNCTKFIS